MGILISTLDLIVILTRIGDQSKEIVSGLFWILNESIFVISDENNKTTPHNLSTLIAYGLTQHLGSINQ